MASSAKINRKIIMDIQLETLSPLRIASGMEDGITDILILKDKNDKAFIPGTSIAGALKSKIQSVYGKKCAEKVFGDINDNGNQSMINISDVSLSGSKLITRDGVAINPFTGVGIPGAKYDYEAVDKGAKGNLHIEVTVRDFDVDTKKVPTIKYRHKKFAASGDVYAEIIATCADVFASGISFGSLTAKGYGRVGASGNVELFNFDFRNESAVDAWLKYIRTNKCKAESLYIAKAGDMQIGGPNDMVIEAEFALTSSLIVRDMYGAAERSKDDETLVAVQMRSGNDYVIHGTSVKGVLRNKAVRIMTSITGSIPKANEFINNMMGFANDESGTGKKSKLVVEEIYIPKNLLSEQKHSRNRINRFTAGTVDSALFTEMPIWQQDKDASTVKMKLMVEDCNPSEAGLMLLLIKEMWLGNLNFGGGKSIGRGVLKGKSLFLNYNNIAYELRGDKAVVIRGDKESLEGYVKNLGEIK